MHSVSILSALALVGSTFAAPIAEPEVVKVVVTKVATVVVTEGVPQAAPTQAAPPKENVQVNHYRPAQPSVVVVTKVYGPKPTNAPAPQKPTTQAPPPAPKPTTQAPPPAPKPTTQAPAPAPQPTYAPAPAPAPAPSTGGSSGNYMDVVKNWRSKMGLPELKYDATLEANAQKTCRDGNGQMVHQLNKGTFGQVLAPGKPNEFEHVFVGGWLCEVPNTKGLDGVCATQSKGFTYGGQTGHNEILVDPKKTKIGCACVKDIWGCDLA